MAQHFRIHPDNPQPRLIRQAAAVLREGGVVAYPTDSCYALGCLLDQKQALERIVRIRGLQPDHLFTFLCRDLSGISTLARVDNSAFRLIKSLTPGPYTFILRASREVPKRLQNPKRKTIGLRIPDNKICQELLRECGEPLLSTSLILAEGEGPEGDPRTIRDRIGKVIELVIDAGTLGMDETSIIDLSGERVEIVRRGKGDTSRI
jgi:tRNA threonylcarbamoyl adenosine modification protein (Sua5/YciO/YrdC/YwlC family)